MTQFENDQQFQEYTIQRVSEDENGYTLTHSGRWMIFCPKVKGFPAPQVGEILRTYGRGIGYTVRGITVNGRVYRYATEEQENAAHKQWCLDQEAEREQKLAANIADHDARIAALPKVFRERLEKFQRDGGHAFRRDYEDYELFCCEQAVLIADTLKTPDAIADFKIKSWTEQKQLVPGLDDEHSGNTFGSACAMAFVYLKDQELVTKLHGALTPLVGCEAYGCKHDKEE